MADVRISELPLANTPVDSTSVVPVVTGGSTKRASISQLGFLPAGSGASTRTIQDKLRDAVSVKDFGAVGDGVTNDTAAIQAALNSGAKCVCVPAGTYRIGSWLSVPSNVTVEGDGAGSVIKPLDSSGDAASPILSLRNVENVVVRDIVLDGNVTNLTATFGHCGAWLSGARGCLFERVVFQDIGQSATTYAGVHCNVTAYETGDAQATAFDITGVSTEKCVWRDCLFKDADAKASFGLRLYTNFDNPIADNAFTKEVRDCQIINCQFTGFAFNSVELAGPGVHSNLVSGCVFDGHRGYGTIDIDKGATDNEAVDCSIRNVLAKKLNNAEVAVASPIARIQGYDNGAGIVRYSRRNAIRNLHIDGLGQMVSNSFAVLMDYAYDCEVSGGYWNVSIASGISSGGKFGTRVKNCIFRDVSVVGLTGNGDAFSNRSYTTITEDCTDNAVINCRAACSYNGVWFENTGSFVSSNIEVRACYFTGVTNVAVKFVKQVDALAVENVVVAPTGAAYAMHADNCTRPRFSQNTIRKPSTDGIQVDANCTEAVLDSNVITEVQSGGWLGIHDLATATHVVGNYIQRVQNSDIRGRKETWGSAAPTAGSWKIGDVVYNTAPAAGNFVGWICVTTGTPGTWKTFGAISV